MNKLEEHLYATAAQEVAAKRFVPALMAKAFSDADGDEKKSIARYIKLRVQQLAEEVVAAQAEAEVRQERAAREREERQRAEAEAELRRSGAGLTIRGLSFRRVRDQKGIAFCFVCRRTDQAVLLLYCETHDIYGHMKCLKEYDRTGEVASD